MRASHDWFCFYFWLVEKVAWFLLTNHVKGLKCGKMSANKSWFDLVLVINGWQNGGIFLANLREQTWSIFDTQLKTTLLNRETFWAIMWFVTVPVIKRQRTWEKGVIITFTVLLVEEFFKMFHFSPVPYQRFKREAIFRNRQRSVRFFHRYSLLLVLVFSITKLIRNEISQVKGTLN